MKDCIIIPKKGPNINPCGTAPKRECQTDMQGTCSHLTSQTGSRTFYMRTVFSVNQLSSIPACHFIRICIFPVINMSLVMESDALYWLNWADFLYGMHFFWGGDGGCISLFMSHRAEHQGRWDDKGTEGESVMVTCTKKEEVKKAAHVCKNRT